MVRLGSPRNVVTYDVFGGAHQSCRRSGMVLVHCRTRRSNLRRQVWVLGSHRAEK